MADDQVDKWMPDEAAAAVASLLEIAEGSADYDFAAAADLVAQREDRLP